MKNKAFTLIEILIAIAVIGIIAGIVIVQMNKASDSGNDSRRKVDIETIKSGIVSYRAEHNNTVPVENCDIGVNCSSLVTALTPFVGSSLPTDPVAGTYYHYQSTDGANCSLYAKLSDGTVYEYDCQSNAAEILTPVNGACGADGGATLDAKPTNLCAPGTPSAVTGSNSDASVGPWLWTCQGENTGSNASCYAYMSDNFSCQVAQGACSGVILMHLYDPAGGHAEMPDQTNYTWNVCCTGGGITNTCGGNYAVALKLYDVTKSHVEKNTQSNYTNNICISAVGKTAACNYASDCSTLGSGYQCLASISDGDTGLHAGNCSAFTQKVCCKIETIK